MDELAEKGIKNIHMTAELSELGLRLHIARLKAESPGLGEGDYERLFYRRVRAAKDAALLRDTGSTAK